MSKEAGSLMAMSVNIDKPTAFKIDKMDFNQICFMVGKNGSGKSLILKLNWCLSMIANYYAIKTITGISIDIPKEFQFIMDNTFDEQNFNGTIEAFFQNMTIIAQLENGKVTSIDATFDDDLAISKFPIFMSKETRTFDAFTKYMKTKKLMSVSNDFFTFTSEELQKITEFYKLYDILFMEMMIKGLNNYTLSDELKKELLENFEIKEVIDRITVDKDACELYGHNDAEGTTIKLTRLSAGEQSLINMIIANKVV